ncbi:TetR/AcrR family transcriptional regulator [Paratractidigestivibacter sp.]|uniref:TetR/AcrR family transcriptional regulator n=1 Tax=Paratractidigestivibacter sp. TaxID=2847316 RepID=UPI002ABE442D|nr:TetR/AcrR family transcriptional regulator [Paratractidigestivibacter sp.]
MEEPSVAGKRREQIVSAACSLYEHKGIDRTSVKDMTDAVGITRSLFYHYFSSKDEVTDAVLDRYVEGFVAEVRIWNELRVERDVAGALRSAVKLLRGLLLERDSLRLMLLKDENASLYLRFAQRVSEAVAHYLTDTTAVDYAKFHTLEIKRVYESFYLLTFGLIGYVRQHPEASDELLADLIADTLHLDLSEAHGN